MASFFFKNHRFSWVTEQWKSWLLTCTGEKISPKQSRPSQLSHRGKMTPNLRKEGRFWAPRWWPSHECLNNCLLGRQWGLRSGMVASFTTAWWLILPFALTEPVVSFTCFLIQFSFIPPPQQQFDTERELNINS